MTAAIANRHQTVPARRRAIPSKPNLRVLDQASIRRRARRRNAVLALFLVVLSAFFLVAFVHARLVESQHELDQMRSQIAEFTSERARAERAVDEASTPATIVERATALGMVRSEEPMYLRAVRDPSNE